MRERGAFFLKKDMFLINLRDGHVCMSEICQMSMFFISFVSRTGALRRSTWDSGGFNVVSTRRIDPRHPDTPIFNFKENQYFFETGGPTNLRLSPKILLGIRVRERGAFFLKKAAVFLKKDIVFS